MHGLPAELCDHPPEWTISGHGETNHNLDLPTPCMPHPACQLSSLWNICIDKSVWLINWTWTDRGSTEWPWAPCINHPVTSNILLHQPAAPSQHACNCSVQVSIQSPGMDRQDNQCCITWHSTSCMSQPASTTVNNLTHAMHGKHIAAAAMS